MSEENFNSNSVGLAQKRHLVDPDYEDVREQETKRQKLIEEDGKNLWIITLVNACVCCVSLQFLMCMKKLSRPQRSIGKTK